MRPLGFDDTIGWVIRNVTKLVQATTLPAVCNIALKEWAVTVRALDRGEQILLLRKGGIREEGRNFQMLYPEFLLYPTLEHQKEELLKEQYHGDLRQVLNQAQASKSITFSHWARVEEVIELADQEKVDSLSPHYIWTKDYAQKRLHWQPRHPLSMMLVRTYRLEQPQAVPYVTHYGGCKSWVELAHSVSLGNLAPVLTDEEFSSTVGQVKGALEP